MKLCDRCTFSPDCGCFYLGVSCYHARKMTCPEVQPNNAEALSGLDIEELTKFITKWLISIQDTGVITQGDVRAWLEAKYKT